MKRKIGAIFLALFIATTASAFASDGAYIRGEISEKNVSANSNTQQTCTGCNVDVKKDTK